MSNIKRPYMYSGHWIPVQLNLSSQMLFYEFLIYLFMNLTILY